ncbi:MAG: hypothetical protein RDU41_09745 [Clostridia bacterium]|nr:hypothetical protein [Clostridia bacterium]
MANVQPQGVQCSLCQATMTYHPPTKARAKDRYWECPECGATVWPYDGNLEKQIRKSMQRPKTRNKGGGSKSRRRKERKPGDKFQPWWA